MKIQELQAGDEIDNLICAKIMGYFKPDRVSGKFSADMASAWELRMRMEMLGWISKDELTWMGWVTETAHPWGYSIWFERWDRGHDKFCFHAHVKDRKDAPLAICKAALLAMNGDPKDAMA